MEMFEGFSFTSEEDCWKLNTAIKKFEDLCVGETNETYERFVFNRRDQENETVDQYVAELRKLARTCNFCSCLQDSLLRDRLVLGIKDVAVRKKLLQDRQLTLQRAIDICRSGETTSKQLRELKKPPATEEIHAIAGKRNKKTETGNQRDTRHTRNPSCKYCGGTHEDRRSACPAFGQTCKKCARKNHFARVCQQSAQPKGRSAVRYVSASYVTSDSDDSGDSVLTLELSSEPSLPDDILAVNYRQVRPKIYVPMKIKGGREITFQVDTGATCNVIRSCELLGTKYENNIASTTQILKMFNSSPLKPIGNCRVQLTNPQNGRKYKVEFTVVRDGDAKVNLIGSAAAQQMALIQVNYKNMAVPAEVNVVNKTFPRNIGITEQQLVSQYRDVFDGLGALGEPLHLEVDNTVKPVQVPPRRVPEALKKPLKDHLDEL